MIHLPLDVPTPAAVSRDKGLERTALTTAALSVSAAPSVAVYDNHDSGFSDSVVANSRYEQAPSSFARGDLTAYAVRMVAPFQREFGRTMDVTRFLYDADCARQTIRLALTSKDARLRGYAMFLDIKMFGAKVPVAVPVPAVAVAAAAAPVAENAALQEQAACVPSTPQPKGATPSLRRWAQTLDLVV